ncbi:MAG TPA: methyltransferase domain-containing protein [Acidimicrobiales bacterium]|nr:methyltransferase domain-containing protein [Acidimicrobiales bacterium]
MDADATDDTGRAADPCEGDDAGGTAEPGDAKRSVATLFGSTAGVYDSVVPFFATFGRTLVAEAGPRLGDRVLDVCCGRGACLLPAAEAVGPMGSVLGVDLAAEMIAALADETAGMPQVEVAVMDAETLDVPDAAFDVVLCGFGIFFLPSPERALAEWRRVLRPGGTVAVSTFVTGGGFPWTASVVRGILPAHASRAASAPLGRAEAVRAALADAGFADVRSTAIERRFLFADLDAVVAWHGTHGGRAFLDRFDPGQLAAFRASATRHLDAGHRAPEGGYELRQGIEVTLASRP